MKNNPKHNKFIKQIKLNFKYKRNKTLTKNKLLINKTNKNR